MVAPTATARAHPDLAARLQRLIDVTGTTKLALVHGDVSPKNILVGPSGPVLLDAECAWYGDPAFDLAFCVNHLLLKSLVVPGCRGELLRSAHALAEQYVRQVDWEPRSALETRTASLLPALLLARVDGKSPVEYLTDDRHRLFVRTLASALLRAPAATVVGVLDAWVTALEAPTETQTETETETDPETETETESDSGRPA